MNDDIILPLGELHVLYGWDFWLRSEAVVPEEVRVGMVNERKIIEGKLKQPGIVFRGRLNREEYLKEMAEAQAWPRGQPV